MGQQTDIFLEQLFRVFLLLDSELCLFLSGLTMLLRLSLSHVPKDCSTSGFPVHCLLEFAQTSVHSVSDTIHLPHPLPFPSLFASNLPQRQGLFQWVGCLHQVAKVLELHFSSSPSSEYSGLTGLILQSKGLSRVSSSTTVRKHQFFGAQLSLWSESTIALTTWIFVGKVMSLLFNMLSRFVIVFLPRRKHLLISWLQM